jgi:hypothetical protein
MSPRSLVLAVAMLAAFVAGGASASLTERNALASAASLSSAVYVPSDGLAFRTLDGRVIARLSYDERGGVLALYDGSERPSTVLHAGSLDRPPTPPAWPKTKSRPVDFGF